MTTAPWTQPELTAIGRLPMHSLLHPDRLSLDGVWRFQLLPRADAEPTADWRDIRVPGCWTMQGTSDRPQYTNIVMPFTDLPPVPPRANPTGVYARSFEVPSGWAGRRVVLHVGAAESVLIVSMNDRDVGISKDSRLAAEFDVTEVVQPGPNALTLRVVKWSDASFVEDQDQWWHGGITRSVFLYSVPPVLATLPISPIRENPARATAPRHPRTAEEPARGLSPSASSSSREGSVGRVSPTPGPEEPIRLRGLPRATARPRVDPTSRAPARSPPRTRA